MESEEDAAKKTQVVEVRARNTKCGSQSTEDSQRISDAAKFRVKGLEHAFEMDELFQDVTATGDKACTPTSGQMPPLDRQSSGVGDGAGLENGDDSEGDNVEDNVRKRTVSERAGKQDKRVKKVSAVTKLSRQLERICEAIETRSSTPSILRIDKPGCSIEEVVDLMAAIPECPPKSELFMVGTRLFLKRENREMFVALQNPNVQLAWLKQEGLYLRRLGCSIKEVLNLMAAIPECSPPSELFMVGTHLFVKQENREIFVALKNPDAQLGWLKQEALFLPQPSTNMF